MGGRGKGRGKKEGREREKRESERARGTEREGEGREGGRPDGKHRISNCNKRTKLQSTWMGKRGVVVRDRSKYTWLDVHTCRHTEDLLSMMRMRRNPRWANAATGESVFVWPGFHSGGCASRSFLGPFQWFVIAFSSLQVACLLGPSMHPHHHVNGGPAYCPLFVN
ncbi:hypothetical protein ASPFODRAFT_453680 [Aspergillus luchuensis CBS 106.47]|uniref:Uncharacterized protein n=1 Tax=Aspergillus luchuensis (strain CBS 106.47) TaxID=1137211 RepID=A0A1M3TXB3_ASPLC|nr:hypothetical protein ASPFODRAFT_453680 [Aspergillus luchuensis CBS 106.47]